MARYAKLFLFASFAAILCSSVAYGAGGGVPAFINYYDMILHGLGLGEEWQPVIGGLFALIVITLMGVYYKRSVEQSGDDVTPPQRFGLRYVIDAIFDMLYQLGVDNCGKLARTYLPFLSALFVFILVCNVSGLVPGFPPATEAMSTNLAMGLLAFFVYNYAGIKEHGGGYIKHFLGPVIIIAPLFLVIEIVSHAARPMSLALRLLANIYADHTLLGVFTGLTFVVAPALLLFFGLLVAVVQSFIFTLLTGIYISLATSHDH